MKASESPTFDPSLSESVKVKADLVKLAAKLDRRAGRVR